jgi:hypothetical protein
MNRTQAQKVHAREAALPWEAQAAARQCEAPAPILDWTKAGIGHSLRCELSAAWAACGAFEWVALGYLGVSCLLIALFEQNLPHPVWFLCLQAFLTGTILTLCCVEAKINSDPAGFSRDIRGRFRGRSRPNPNQGHDQESGRVAHKTPA